MHRFKSASCKRVIAVAVWMMAGTALTRAQTPELVPEGPVRAAWHGDVLHLDAGRGWVRIPRLYSDFAVEFELRLLEPGTHATLGFRSWPGYDGLGSPGYQVSFSERRDAAAPSSKIEARRLNLTLATVDGSAMSGQSHAAGDWHKIRVVVEQQKATVFVDGQLSAAADNLNEFTGYLTLSSDDGTSEFRAIGVGILSGVRDPFGADAHRLTEPGLEKPRLIREVKPFYPREPHDRKIQGAVLVEAVILENGSPGDVHVIRSLDPDLDEAAVAAARKWRFRPAMMNGSPVQVLVTIELSFTLADGRP